MYSYMYVGFGVDKIAQVVFLLECWHADGPSQMPLVIHPTLISAVGSEDRFQTASRNRASAGN